MYSHEACINFDVTNGHSGRGSGDFRQKEKVLAATRGAACALALHDLPSALLRGREEAVSSVVLKQAGRWVECYRSLADGVHYLAALLVRGAVPGNGRRCGRPGGPLAARRRALVKRPRSCRVQAHCVHRGGRCISHTRAAVTRAASAAPGRCSTAAWRA